MSRSWRWIRLQIWVLVFLHDGCYAIQRQKQSDPINQVREYSLISILLPKRRFRILLSCEKLTSVSYTSNLSEQMYGCRKHNVPPEVDFESSRFPAKSESWNSPSLHCFAVLSTWRYCVYSHVWWIYEINRFKRQHRSTHFFAWPAMS